MVFFFICVSLICGRDCEIIITLTMLRIYLICLLLYEELAISYNEIL